MSLPRTYIYIAICFFFGKERVKCTHCYFLLCAAIPFVSFVIHINFRLISGKPRHHLSRNSFVCVRVSGCGDVESAEHLFLSCSTFDSFWPMVRSWIGFSSTESQTLSDHLLQFKYSSEGPRARRSFLQLICLLCVWVVWTKRNHRLFRNSALTVSQLLDKIKLHYWWLKTTNITLISNNHSCWSSPLSGHRLILSLLVVFFWLVIM
jgi:hypothetical protein